MIEGKIISISADRGFGFIQALSGGADVFFHYTVVDADFGSLTVGQPVQYAPDEASETPRAKSVFAGGKPRGPRTAAGSGTRDSRPAKPRPRAAPVYQYGFVTKMHRRKSEGFISADQGGPEFAFDAAAVSGQKKFFELVVGDYVRFVARKYQDDPKQPRATSVMAVIRHVPIKNYGLPRHPRSLGKKPTWR